MNNLVDKKSKTITGIQYNEYISTILNTLKSVAFHEIYVRVSDNEDGKWKELTL